MDTLTFVTELIKALVWPSVVFIIFLVLRKPLSQLIPLMQRLKYKDIEIDFGRKVQELAIEATSELPAPTEARSIVEKLAFVSPRAAVLEAWLKLEAAAIEASKRHQLNLSSSELRSPLTLGRALEQVGVLDKNKSNIYHRLRNLRNAAAHASDFSFDSESAMEYVDLAGRLAEYFRQS